MKVFRRFLPLALAICIAAGLIPENPFGTAAHAETPDGGADTVIGSVRTVYQNVTPDNPAEVFKYETEMVSDGELTFQAVTAFAEEGSEQGVEPSYPTLPEGHPEDHMPPIPAPRRGGLTLTLSGPSGRPDTSSTDWFSEPTTWTLTASGVPDPINSWYIFWRLTAIWEATML